MSVLRSSIFALLALSLLALNAYCQTQREMEYAAMADSEAIDKKLNIIYQQVIKRYQDNTIFIDKLRKAEKTWITYRDAYLHSIFPAEDHHANYGSVFTMCYLEWTQVVTKTRTDQLKELLTIKKPPSNSEVIYRQEEQILNNTYQKVLRVYEKPYLKVLHQTELAWIVFRDADATAFASLGSKSNSTVMRIAKLAELDHQRTKELQQWIDGTEEENVCSGCIPRRRKHYLR